MKKAMILSVVMVAFLATMAIAQEGPAPKIVVPKVRHDFGDVFEQDKYEYTFVVRNQGKADLVIDDVKPG